MALVGAWASPLYAESTAAHFLAREDLAKDAPVLSPQLLALEDFGIEAHSRPSRSTKKPNTPVVFLAAPKSCCRD
jgi:hypothetical protein